MKCKDCKQWGDSNDKGEIRRKCIDTMTLTNKPGYWAFLFTHPNYGCAEFEPK